MIQYADFAAWQNEWLESPAAQSQLAGWKERLAGMPQVLEFPLDRQRPAVQTFQGDHVRVSVPATVARRLRAIADEESATLFMVYLALYELLLHRITGQEDFGVGVPVAQRTLPETEHLMGFMVNTVVMRATLSGKASFRQILRNVRDTALTAFENQDVPLEKVVDSAVTRRDISYSHLFQAMFDLQRSPLGSVTVPGLSMEPLELDIETSKTDLLLILEEKKDAVRGHDQPRSDEEFGKRPRHDDVQIHDPAEPRVVLRRHSNCLLSHCDPF